MVEWLLARSPDEVEMVKEASSPWQRAGDTGVVVVRLHATGEHEGLWVGEIPGLVVEVHPSDDDACTYLVVRFRAEKDA